MDVRSGLLIGVSMVAMVATSPQVTLAQSTTAVSTERAFAGAGSRARLVKLAKGRRLLESGAPQVAEPLFLDLVKEADAVGDHQTASLSEGALGRCRSMLGDEDGAARWYAASEARARTHDLPRPLAFVHLLRGNGAYGRADRDLARREWEQALALFAQVNDVENQAYLLRALAFVSTDSVVDERLKSALQLARRASSGSNEGLALHTMADVAYGRGEWSSALSLAADALPLIERYGTPIENARVHLSLARLHRSHGDHDAAIADYARARTLLSSIERGLGVAQAWSQLATGLRMLGDLASAVAAAEAGVRVATLSGSPSDNSVAAFAYADALLQQDRSKEALAVVDAVGSFDRVIAKGLTVSRASALSRLGRHNEAMEVAATAETIQGDWLDRLPIYSSMLAEVRWRAGDRVRAVRDANEAVATIERLRAHAASLDQLRAGFDEGFQDAHSRLVRMLFDTGAAEESLAATEGARARAFADLLASRELKAHQRSFAHVTESRVSLADFSAEARRLHSTIVAYWTEDDGVLIWVVNGNGLQAHRYVKVKAEHLASLVQRSWDTAEPLAGSGRPSAFQELHALLIAPVQQALPSTTRLTIVPHGPLFRLSFAGLQRHDGQHLIERFAIHYVPSVAASIALGGSRSTSSLSRTVMIVADPDLGSERRRAEGLRPLPGATAEGAAVARVFGPASSVLTKRQATEQEVRSLAPTRRVLHFATHAVASDTQPMDSFLALAGAAQSAADDGRLTAEEVYGMSLDAELVVLSGCRTASGQVTGDGVVGLSRAFFVAGTPSIVASLWDLPDASGLEVLPEFYRQWNRSSDKADALRVAQLQALERMRAGRFTVSTPAGPMVVKAHPAVWAGLVLLGQP